MRRGIKARTQTYEEKLVDIEKVSRGFTYKREGVWIWGRFGGGGGLDGVTMLGSSEAFRSVVDVDEVTNPMTHSIRLLIVHIL